jgi:RHS repeat-associated protein
MAARYSLYDMIGTARRLADASGTTTDAYSLDAFGRSLGGWGSTESPYRYGAAWGYLTDPSGMQQLGARFYWPELGRFIQPDPIGDGMSWYAYVGGHPVVAVDPSGLLGAGLTGSAAAVTGVWAAGAGIVADYGVGLFTRGPHFASYKSGGSWAGYADGRAPNGWRGPSYPETDVGDPPPAGFGAMAGIGGGVWFTNAPSVACLKGPFRNVHAGVAALIGVSVNIATDMCGHYVVSVTAGPGLGGYIGGHQTDTWYTTPCSSGIGAD